MRSIGLVVALALVPFCGAAAQTAPLKPELWGISFLVGGWSSGRGVVADTGGTSTGSSAFTLEAGGAVLLRRDHTNLFDATGKPAGGFDQIMMIYPEGGTLHADYADGVHVIHYTSALVQPGKSVVFTSASTTGAPTFRLSYALSDPETLSVSFAMAPPGSATFHPIAVGALTKTR